MTDLRAPPTDPVAPGTGAIHDLGYKRYVGTRRPPSTRWRVICRHQMAHAWKTWWRYKAAVGGAVIATFVWGGLMYFLSNKAFRGMGRVGALMVTYTDAALPMSMEWYCRIAFYLSLTIGAAAIAGDVQSGAFTFYFARSVRPRDYVLGKLVGFAVLVGSLCVLGPLVLALVRLGVCDTLDEAVGHLILVPKAIAIGALATLAYATVPLGFSALLPNRRYALAAWAAYYMVFGTIAQYFGFISNSSIAVLDLPTAVTTVAYQLFDIVPLWGRREHWGVPTRAALASIGIHAAVAIAIVWYRVIKDQKAGIGGAS